MHRRNRTFARARRQPSFPKRNLFAAGPKTFTIPRSSKNARNSMRLVKSPGKRMTIRAKHRARVKPDPALPIRNTNYRIEWLGAREKIIAAQKQHDSKESKTRVLLICASPRTDQTCPSEMSKTFR